MTYQIDHDLHIHSQLSLCSGDAEQTTERILRYARQNGLRQICLTDHFWDETIPTVSPFYQPQGLARIRRALPLPCADGVEFLFGAETDLTSDLTLGITPATLETLDFLIVPTTHMHMAENILPEHAASSEGRAISWMTRLDGLLDMPLPFHKVGIAHLACCLIDHSSRENYLRVLSLLDEDGLARVFAKAAACGVGIELNASDMSYSDEEREIVLRPFRIAKSQGCKFYLGSDAHHPKAFDNATAIFERAVRDLGLTEGDKFHIQK